MTATKHPPNSNEYSDRGPGDDLMDGRSRLSVRSNGFVYVVTRDGHRGPYIDLLAPLLGLAPVHGKMTFRLFRTFVLAPRMLFATLDEDMLSFTLIALVRSLQRRSTAALFLRPGQCFIPGKLKYVLKRWLFKLLRRLPGLTLLTITPFDLEPHYRHVANVGVHDPQYWDKHDGSSIAQPVKTELSNQLLHQAAGRRLLCLPGAVTGLKGFKFLADILATSPALTDSVLVVATGRVHANMREAAARFAATGGYLVDRHISDEELESLYGVADMVWSCYIPEYDQASGIFGRAVQYGVPVVVRRNSLIDRLATNIEAPVIRLDYDHLEEAATALRRAPQRQSRPEDVDRKAALIGAWRQNFLAAVDNSLS